MIKLPNEPNRSCTWLRTCIYAFVTLLYNILLSGPVLVRPTSKNCAEGALRFFCPGAARTSHAAAQNSPTLPRVWGYHDKLVTVLVSTLFMRDQLTSVQSNLAKDSIAAFCRPSRRPMHSLVSSAAGTTGQMNNQAMPLSGGRLRYNGRTRGSRLLSNTCDTIRCDIRYEMLFYSALKS